MSRFLEISGRRTGALARLALISVCIGTIGGGCERDAGKSPAPTVVVYTSVDEEFARAILDRFETRSGIRVQTLYDTEGGKTTGFIRRLAREKVSPRCDVWWSSEVFGTIELARAGVLAPYDSPAAADIPAAWKDAGQRWTGLAARARVFAYDPRRVRSADVPRTWRQLVGSGWAQRLALANPQFGTTRGQIAAFFAYWGEPAGVAFLQGLRDGKAQIADANSHAVRLVTSGAVDACLTDTDDVWVAQRRGATLDLAYLPLDDGLPALWIPCTVAVIAGAPHAAAAQQLVDFLVSAEVERLLAESDSRNVPIRAGASAATSPAAPRPEALDFERITDALPAAMDAARRLLLE